MKRHYLSLWALLAVSFAVFAITSAFDMPYMGEHQLRSSGIADALTAPHADEEAVPHDTLIATPDTIVKQTAIETPVDTASQTILLIGDSMLEGLGPRLAAYAEHNGHTLYTVMWYSSSSEVWGRSDKLRGYIQRLRPTYIVLCLGANELFVNDIEKRREKYVRKILADIDTIPYLWIGPPNWRDDTGINRLIERNAGRGSFFLSKGMSFERAKDGAHPTRSSASAWLDSVMRWMPANASHPIKMEVPQAASARPRRLYVHKPDER